MLVADPGAATAEAGQAYRSDGLKPGSKACRRPSLAPPANGCGTIEVLRPPPPAGEKSGVLRFGSLRSPRGARHFRVDEYRYTNGTFLLAQNRGHFYWLTTSSRVGRLTIWASPVKITVRYITGGHESA